MTTNNATLPTLSPRVLHALLFTPTPDGWGVPAFLWGPPGVGKTKTVRAVATAASLPYIRLSPAERGEGQFGVVPVPAPGPDGQVRLTYPAPDWAVEVADGGLIFVDEANLGGYALQAPLLGLIQLRVLGTHQFGPRVRTLAAANEAHDAPGAHELANSVRNRFAHFRFEGLDAAAWGAGLLGGFRTSVALDSVDAREEEARVLAAWPQAYAQAAAQVAAFVARRPDLLHQAPAKGARVMAWPSRRTWEYATLALASAQVHALTEVDTDALLASLVGLGAATEFATWRATLDLPGPVELLDGKVSWQHDPQRPDRTAVVLSSIAAFLASAPADATRLTRAGVAWGLVDGVIDVAADLAVPAATALVQAKLFYPLVKSDAARKAQAKLKPVLDLIK